MAESYTGKEFNVYRGVDGKLTPTPTKIPSLGPKDILIKITHTGVCFTDRELFHLGAPCALGHEGVGIVKAVGSDVHELKVGDRAGGGFHRHSCGHCKYCLTGNDMWCYERTIFGESDFDNGTFGEYYIGKETYVHKIPDALSSEDAAPLQCAGATVYNALVGNVEPTSRVGIVGIGGLGHLAIQFAAKMGAQVAVFSTSKSKEQEAREFGASEFYLLDETDKLQTPLDVLVVAGSRLPDWEKYVPGQ
jgi:D-arabinose 1-dehydrogenase-like Zn-dependent alcohol dehydrogenase